MDGEISRGATAMDMATLGGTGEVEFRVLQDLTGEPPPYESEPGEASPADRAMASPRIILEGNHVWQSAMSIPKSSALWMQPRHLKVIAQTDEGARLLTEVCQRVLNGDAPMADQAYL
jgi:hypothetical protein